MKCATAFHQWQFLLLSEDKMSICDSVADPGFCQGGGADHGERASLNGGLGAESFLYIFIQNSGQKLRI